MTTKPQAACVNDPKKMETDNLGDALNQSEYASTTSNEPSNKRLKVSPDDPDKIIEDQRRGRIELDKGQRDNVLRWILACHIRLTKLLTGKNYGAAYFDIDISEQVTSIFSTIHATLRQESLNTGNLRQVMSGKVHSIQVNGIMLGTLTHVDASAVVKSMADSFGLEYRKPERSDTNHWHGTASPLISFIVMFKVRVNELRTGHGSFTVQKTSAPTRLLPPLTTGSTVCTIHSSRE